jgi:uncharacterized protein (DUF1778 family)
VPVLKRRDRIVVFRLTEDEYDNLKSACVSRGARNVSDFARSELLLAVERDHSEVIERLSELQSRMRRMEQLLERGRK